MEDILLIALLIVTVAMVGIVLLQRTEGGALGIGGGQSQFLSVRGTANLLTRLTAILATLFLCLALFLAVLANQGREVSAPTLGNDGVTPLSPVPSPVLGTDGQQDGNSPDVPLSQ
ncbi:MAG: preprotein translocase subunit SecG [Alphaproteobacteria bacterium]|nr:preprotein translocase subunit SecG [Alphaproteobacteria bacterium]